MTSPLVSGHAESGFQESTAVETGAFVVTATGLDTTVRGVAYYARFGPLVTLLLPELTGTSNATTMTLTGLPPSIVALRTFFSQAIRVTNNSSDANNGYLRFNANSTVLDVFRNADITSAWTGSGTKTLRAVAVSYLLR